MKIFRSLISYLSARKVRSTKKMASLVLNVNLKDKIKNLQKNLLTILNKKKINATASDSLFWKFDLAPATLNAKFQFRMLYC